MYASSTIHLGARARRHRLRGGLLGLLALAGVALPALRASATPRTHLASAFPVTVQGVRLASRPDRIISLSPTATEMLFADGAGSQVVAVDDDSDYPANAPRTSLSGLSPNVEAIAKYRPDLVVLSYNPSGFASRLKALHVPVLIEPAALDLSGTYAQIDALGKATGHLAKAKALVDSMRSKIALAYKDAPKFKAPISYYYELSEDPYYSATDSTFIGSVLAPLGLRSIADAAKGAASSGGYPELSEEFIVKSDPRLILLADTICCHQSLLTVAKRPGWSAIAAVRAHAVVGLNDDIASRWGPRIVDLVESVEQALWKLKSALTS